MKSTAKALANRAQDAASRGATAVNKMRAERTDGLLDERMQAKHNRLMAPPRAKSDGPPAVGAGAE